MRSSRRLGLSLVAALLPAVVWANHLGTIGPTYPIGEESALEVIMRKLEAKARSGELDKLQQEATRRSLASVEHMRPVPGITTVQRAARRLIDPSVTYQQPVVTEDGQILAPAGTTINPFDVMTLSKVLVFFDGRDPAQREAVGRLLKSRKGELTVKPILVAGSWLDLSRTWNTQVYFDQNGVLIRRFGITAVPSVLRQQGRMLQLHEIPAGELR